MKKYDEYKDSGVAWIGEVPKHWEVIPLKFTGAFGNGLTYSPKDVVDNGILVLRSSNIQNSSLSFEDNVYVSKVSRDLLVNKGDVIICSRNGSAALVGKSAFVDKELNATFGAFMMRYIPNIDKKYGFYLFQTAIGQYKGYFSTTTINQLTKTTIGEIKIPLAMAEEQTAIATYLDTHCAKIDNLISIQQKRIALLQELKQSVITHAVTKGLNPNVEMKPSGVEWIGDVPKHWEILRGKYVLNILSGFPFDSQKFEFEDNGVYMPLIRIRDINCSSTEVYYSGSYPIESVVKTGEVLIGMDGDFNISKWKGTNALLNQRVCKLREDSSMNTHYAFYMLSSPLKAINSVTYATTVKHLSVYDIYNVFIPVPPIPDQAAIASYLDHKCATIDTSISNAQHQIDLLQEYKQSLITEVVTGKYKVC